jgi:16S rRNA (guanine966-N2)-methyltransferase
MRIIAGEFRGRILLPPRGPVTRPITDRVKQSLFDILNERIPGCVAYDCFSGTGSLGLESLSRGAERAVFFESHHSAAAILRRNIAALGVDHRSQVVTDDLFIWAAKAPPPAKPADLLFLDPPYHFLTDRGPDLQRLIETLAKHHLAPDAVVVFRHASGDSLDLPPLRRYDQREYGSMTIELLTCPFIPTSTSPRPTQPR